MINVPAPTEAAVCPPGQVGAGRGLGSEQCRWHCQTIGMGPRPGASVPFRKPGRVGGKAPLSASCPRTLPAALVCRPPSVSRRPPWPGLGASLSPCLPVWVLSDSPSLPACGSQRVTWHLLCRHRPLPLGWTQHRLTEPRSQEAGPPPTPRSGGHTGQGPRTQRQQRFRVGRGGAPGGGGSGVGGQGGLGRLDFPTACESGDHQFRPYVNTPGPGKHQSVRNWRSSFLAILFC